MILEVEEEEEQVEEELQFEVSVAYCASTPSYCTDLQGLLTTPDHTLFILQQGQEGGQDTSAVVLEQEQDTSTTILEEVLETPLEQGLATPIGQVLDMPYTSALEPTAAILGEVVEAPLAPLAPLVAPLVAPLTPLPPMVAPLAPLVAPEASMPPPRRKSEAENMEEIERFLQEELVEEAEGVRVKEEVKEVRLSKDSSYKIPKSPLKARTASTPTIPYTRAGGFRVVSVGQASLQGQGPSARAHSFEEALNTALGPGARARDRVRPPASRAIKVVRAEPMLLQGRRAAATRSPQDFSFNRNNIYVSLPPARQNLLLKCSQPLLRRLW